MPMDNSNFFIKMFCLDCYCFELLRQRYVKSRLDILQAAHNLQVILRNRLHFIHSRSNHFIS